MSSDYPAGPRIPVAARPSPYTTPPGHPLWPGGRGYPSGGYGSQVPPPRPGYVPGYDAPGYDVPGYDVPGYGYAGQESLRREAIEDEPPEDPAPGRRPGRPLRGVVYRFEVRSLRIIWSTIFFAVVFVPLVLAPRAGGQVRPWSRGGLAIELCMTTGLLALSALAATVVLPSRMRTILKAFGIEGMLHSHKLLALVATGLVVLHVAFVVADRPMSVMLLWPVTAPPRALAGESATIAMMLLCYLSLRRRRMGTRYELWRMGHAILAVGAIAGTYLHIYFLNHLMQDAAERSVFVAILLFIAGIFANRWVLRPLRARKHAYVIKDVRPETPSTSTLVLAPSGRRQRMLRYRAGQFCWIRLDSPFGPLQGHPFSISSAPQNMRELHFTIRNAGDFTGTVVVLTPGRKVFVDGPYGDFNDDHLKARQLLLISGGIGITPNMSLLRSHAYRRDRRPHVFLNCAQTEAELMFRNELRHLERIMNLRVYEVLSKPPPGWRGLSGRLDADLLDEILDANDLEAPDVFICGPPAMMQATREALVEVGIDDRHIHTEDFAMV